MTYHSPGRPRSSSRRAVTGSTGSAGSSASTSVSSVSSVSSAAASSASAASAWSGSSASAASTMSSSSSADSKAPAVGSTGSFRFGSDTVAASSWIQMGGTCERGAHEAPSAGSAEDVLDDPLESEVNHGNQTDHDDDEDNHHSGVCRQLAASRPDDLAQLGDDLAVEQRETAQRALLSALAALPGLLLRLGYFILGIRHVDGAHGVRHATHLIPGHGRAAPGGAARRCIEVRTCAHILAKECVAGPEGLEPPTAGFGDQCSTN